MTVRIDNSGDITATLLESTTYCKKAIHHSSLHQTEKIYIFKNTQSQWTEDVHRKSLAILLHKAKSSWQNVSSKPLRIIGLQYIYVYFFFRKMVGVFLEVVFIFVFAWTNFVANESETYLTEVKQGHATIKCEEKVGK